MYLPSSFQETRLEVLHGLMRAHPLATLVSLHEADIVANHIPVQTLASAPLGLIRGHVARANPVWRQHDSQRDALCVFQGAHAYISPSLYPSKEKSGEVVPTWDYAVVHAHGKLRFIHDAAWLLALVSSLTDAHEAPRQAPWAVGDAPIGYVDKMLKAIVGFELTITRLTGKWKVSQNRDAADQLGVIAGLRAAGDANSRAVADSLAAWGSDPGQAADK